MRLPALIVASNESTTITHLLPLSVRDVGEVTKIWTFFFFTDRFGSVPSVALGRYNGYFAKHLPHLLDALS